MRLVNQVDEDGGKKEDEQEEGEMEKTFIATLRQLNSMYPILDGGSVQRAAGTDRSCAKR